MKNREQIYRGLPLHLSKFYLSRKDAKFAKEE